MIVCSTEVIRVRIFVKGVSSQRDFSSVQELLDSAKLSAEDQALLRMPTNVRYWWKDDLVLFPDKINSSLAMVEVIDKAVFVGMNTVLTFEFSSIPEALEFADEVNKRWLAFDGTAEEFVRLLEEENSQELTQDQLD